ncbi:unnamed protein product, partial [Nesidiocoris tenuis]
LGSRGSPGCDFPPISLQAESVTDFRKTPHVNSNRGEAKWQASGASRDTSDTVGRPPHGNGADTRRTQYENAFNRRGSHNAAVQGKTN